MGIPGQECKWRKISWKMGPNLHPDTPDEFLMILICSRMVLSISANSLGIIYFVPDHGFKYIGLADIFRHNTRSVPKEAPAEPVSDVPKLPYQLIQTSVYLLCLIFLSS